MKYRFIYENRKQFRLGKMCKVLEVSRSGYHSYIKRRMLQGKIKREKLLESIKRIYYKYRCVYGSPRIHRELLKEGIKSNKKTVARLMRINGIRAITKRKYKVTTDSWHNHPVAENIVGQNFYCSEVNKIWLSDITYIWTKEGWLYLACILDLSSRKIVGFSVQRTLSSSLVISSLMKAVKERGVNFGLIFHSDRGSQYASNEVKRFLDEHNMIQSMSRKGNCYDNAVMESFFHTIKSELIRRKQYQTRQEAELDIFDYIEIFYNRQRSHSSLDYLSPFEFENALKHKLVA